jgi:hypothetical protein
MDIKAPPATTLPAVRPSPADLAKRINEKYSEIVASLRTTFMRAVEIGELLEQAKDELAELDHKADVTDLRRAQIAAQLRRTIRDNRDERRTVIKEHRNAMRLQRRALAEEREQERKEQRTERLARLSPEALAKLKASIAELKESTKEELRQEAKLAQLKEKQERAAFRRWRTNGSGNELKKGASET